MTALDKTLYVEDLTIQALGQHEDKRHSNEPVALYSNILFRFQQFVRKNFL